ncbi:unnamed protein product [Enterobius vermicularis]|uniref:DUF948 domain-containing protein n=1 Tax=Enterobius vermicularis TaxID=51028 RepID=A0A0N4VIQ4_ENTVE|nr:unnamed protein product [Enterobius vermicularis]
MWIIYIVGGVLGAIILILIIVVTVIMRAIKEAKAKSEYLAAVYADVSDEVVQSVFLEEGEAHGEAFVKTNVDNA